MATLTIQQALDMAKKDPNSEFANILRKQIESGKLDIPAQKQGVDLTPYGRKQPEQAPTGKDRFNNTMNKIADFTGGKELSQGLGQALTQRSSSKMIEEQQAQQFDLQGRLLERIKANKAEGKDTSRLEAALSDLGDTTQQFGQDAEQVLNPNELTDKQVLGDALQLGTTVATISGLSGAGKATTLAGKTVPGLTKSAPGIAQNLATKVVGEGVGLLPGAARGFIAGAGQGLVSGSLLGTSQGLQQDGNARDIANKAISGGVTGLIGGGIIGSILGGTVGAYQSRKLRNEVLNSQIELGQKTPFDVNNLTPQQSKALEIARTQGIDQKDVEFMLSMKPQDKAKAQQMIELAEEASKNRRALERPIDVVGDSMVDRVKYIQAQNKQAGKTVNEVAKTLRGKPVNAQPVFDQAQELIDDLNITRNPDGKLNFDNSVFKNTPSLQRKLQKFISEVPRGQADAYDVHIFKKSIDELVDFGTQGEGLKGNSERILKSLRSTADDVLDNTFEEYNKANTDFRLTKSVLDEVDSLFGKKVGIGKERGGQLLRSVFSNSTQRPRVMQLVENLDNVANQYGGKFSDNLVDQALFTEILEDVYGTQATTSLQGQTERAIKGTQRVIEGFRNPLQGAGDLAATAAEKTLGISDENKRRILNALIR